MQEPKQPHFKLEAQVGSGLNFSLIVRAYETYKDARVSQSSKKADQQWIYLLDVNDDLSKEIVDLWIKVIFSQATFVMQSLILELGSPGLICPRQGNRQDRLRSLPNQRTSPLRKKEGLQEVDGLAVIIPLSQWPAGNGSLVNKTIEQGEYFVIDGMRKISVSASRGGVLFVNVFLKFKER